MKLRSLTLICLVALSTTQAQAALIDKRLIPADPAPAVTVAPAASVVASTPVVAPKPTPVAATPPVKPSLPHWKIEKNEKISSAFDRWAKGTNKYQVVWEAPELVAQLDIDVQGTFEEVVEKVIDALNVTGTGLQAKFYTANEASQVLRILEKQ